MLSMLEIIALFFVILDIIVFFSLKLILKTTNKILESIEEKCEDAK